MTQNSRFELVSFDVCPFVQRSVITLKHKKVDFKLTFIDLEKPPEWFNQLSPLGKVPLLLVRDGGTSPTVLFESAVINEYVDEVTPPSVLPKEPLQRAFERAWISVSGDLLMGLFGAMMAESREAAAQSEDEIWEILSHVEKAVSGGSCFSSRGFSLVDAAFAPFFMRLLMSKPLRESARWKALPKTRKWAAALLELPEVRDSVIPAFKERYAAVLKAHGSPRAAEIG